MSLNLIKIKILSFQIRKFPRLCIHISRSRAHRLEGLAIVPGRGGKKGASKRKEGIDSVARILDVIAEAPLRLYTGKQQSDFQAREGGSTVQPGQLFPRGTVLMEATVESAPACTLRNYSNAGVVTLRLFVSHRFIDDSKNASF